MLNRHHNLGFTLLEGIIAMTVISVGLVAAISLAVVNIGTAKSNEQRIIAANLAREGVEVIRNMRDSNWLKVDLNKSYPSDATGSTQSYMWDSFLIDQGSWLQSEPNPAVYAIEYVPAATSADLPEYHLKAVTSAGSCSSHNYLDCCIASTNNGINDCQINYDGTTQLYSTAEGRPSAYQRIITLQDICYVDSQNKEVIVDVWDGCGSVSGANADRVGVVVTSQVRYPVSGGTQDIIARERLYNWR